MVHFTIFSAFSHNKFRRQDKYHFRSQMRKRSVSGLRDYGKLLCLLLPLLSSPNTAGALALSLWLDYRRREEGTCVPQCWPHGNCFTMFVDQDGRNSHGKPDSGSDSLCLVVGLVATPWDTDSSSVENEGVGLKAGPSSLILSFVNSLLTDRASPQKCLLVASNRQFLL